MSNVTDTELAENGPADMRIGDWIFEAAQRLPERVLFFENGTELTLGQVADDALRLAHGMLARGLKAGERVVVQLGNRSEAAVVMAACLAAGAIFAPLNPACSATEMDAYLRRLRPSFYFGEAQCCASVADLPASVLDNERRFVVGEVSAGAGLPSWRTLQRDAGGPLPSIDAQAPAVLLQTSGTTGTPKFVAHTQASLAQYVERVLGFGFGDSTRMIFTLSCFDVSGLTGLLCAMSLGMSAVLQDGFDADAYLNAIEEYSCTALFLTPYMTSSVNKAQRMRPRRVDSLQLCVVGGDVCHPSILQAFSELFDRTLHPSWGMTESIGTLSGGQTPGAYVGAADCARLVDEDGNDVRDGDEGELVIRGGNVFKGYWLGPDQLDEGRRNGWFHTGDIMRKDQNGEFVFVARKKDLIVINGDNVAPAEVEHALLLHPAVAEAAVIGVPDVALGERIVGFVVLEAAAGVTPEDILRDVRKWLVAYKVPERLLVVDRIPRNRMGKAIRPRLREQATQMNAGAGTGMLSPRQI
jgi:long-chain acyl-CoA synthetase